MEKKLIATEKAPAAIGPYSQGVLANGTLYVSGQLPLNPATGTIPETIEEQTEQALKNVMAIVTAAGGTAENIVKCGLYIRDMTAFSRINEVYSLFFPESYPARFVVEVSKLPRDAQIEIEAIAVL